MSFAPRSEWTGTFRTVTRPDDVDAVDALVRLTGVFNDSEVAIARELIEDNLERGMRSEYRFLFADGPDRLLGYTCFGPIPATNHRWELYWIAVHPSAQRFRLGALLQKASEDAVRSLGGVYLIAETSTRPDYAPARKFYQAQGYALLGEIPDWHDDDDGLAIFGKRL